MSPDGKNGRVRLGRRGEALVENHLRQCGWTILDRRFRAGRGEVDLVAREGETLVFVEVRTRRTGESGSPEESVTPGKQRRIASAARCWLAAMTHGEPPCRFDVVAVELDGEHVNLRHHRDAFRPG